MVTPTDLKRAGWLGVAVAIVAFFSCRDFDQAYYDQCIEKKLCYEEGEDAGTDGGILPNDDGGTLPTDGGTDGGTNPNDAGADGGALPGNDGGSDGGTNPNDDAGTDGGIPPDTDGGSDGGAMPGPDAGDDGGYSGGPDGGTQVMDASVPTPAPELKGCAAGLCLRDQYVLRGPYEFQGLWGSSPDEVFLAARALPDFELPAQVVRFSGGHFSASTVDLPGFQPFRLQGTSATNLWAITEAPATRAFSFDGRSWTAAGYVTNREAIIPPAFYVGPMSVAGEPLVAIAGPDEKNLYAATGSEVLRWTPGARWLPEAALPHLHGQAPSVQDIWVSRDGSDVWVTLETSYVLRKHGGQWDVVHLPAAPGFSALQVQGFDTPDGDLWITGTWSSGGSFGTSAYHYQRQEP